MVIWSFVGFGNITIVFELFGGLSEVMVLLIISVSVTEMNVVSVTLFMHVSAIKIMETLDVSMQFPEVVITLMG